ncbi:hypothetical protein T4A_12251 [Trichinella pseudospiralis]|uniref:Uncharacterized protein n=2 Tax=Trichinella pseudospiralis TaxID=6337 RepID=A0A0V1E976_TRIPS|nr:hypothetical protein T4A_12251 [Trichinella pseudospiralis]KRZ23957.1 hypothetical protein T4C_289 [Trichinella pseudospiralis]KRZ24113.1 hypothetical protein T4C_2500 [Trichinella pseudospiralis]
MPARVEPCETDRPINFAKWKDKAKRKYTEFVESLMGESLSNDANLSNDNLVYGNSTSQEETAPENEEYSFCEKCFLKIIKKGEYFCNGNYLNNLLVKPSDRAKMAADAKLLLRDFDGTFIDYPEILLAAANSGVDAKNCFIVHFPGN